MDKNTFWGMLLMALVIFGFMWLNKPSQAELDAQRQAHEQAQQQEAAQQSNKSLAPLSEQDVTRIANTIQTYGAPVADSPGVYRLTNETLDVSYNTVDSVFAGTVKVGADRVDVEKIVKNDMLDLTPERAFDARETLIAAIGDINKFKSFAKFLGGANTQTVLENDQVCVTFGTRGGCVEKVVLKKYKTETTDPVSDITLFDRNTNNFNFTIVTAEQRINTADLNFRVIAKTDTSIVMGLPLANGVDWQIRYTLVPDVYIVKMEVLQKGIAQLIPLSTSNIEFNWSQNMRRNEVGRTFEERNSTVFYKCVDERPDELNSGKADDENIVGRIQWVAFKNQFFSSVVIPAVPFTTADVKSTPVDKKDSQALKDMSLKATMPYSNANGCALEFDFYFGPNLYPLLSSLDDHIAVNGDDLQLNKLVPLGWWLFRWINTLIIIPVFTFLGHYITNYGIIILLLTLFIKLILFPFTYKSYVSQAKMRVLAPEIKEINEKFPGDENAMKRQQETMALYSRAGASPFSGCLPMLLQMPVLIAMFTFFPSAIELRGQSFLWAHDLSAPDVILTLPFSIPFYGSHVSLFCLLMTIVNIIYTRITMASNPSQSTMPGMKWMMYLMPLMFLFFFNDYASGLSYYYLLSLLITIIQTYAIRHFFVKEDKVRAQMLENARKPSERSGCMGRLAEAQKQQEALQRQQARQQAKKRR